MSNEITTYLKYAHLQIAAEAFIAPKISTPGNTTIRVIDKDLLENGNERTSKFTETDAQWFTETWTVVEFHFHIYRSIISISILKGDGNGQTGAR